ncbi:MAG TPA: spermidine synthase, partial [Candidatus Binatia bacterium]|nr:spermidine synthase [Candidatus Binatia bacterium]
MILRRPSGLLSLLFFFSGTAALGCQMVWVRMFAAGLGHEVQAMVAVAGAFLGGMAVGAWCLDGPISRSVRPGRWYGALQLATGGWAAFSAVFLPPVNHLALALLGPAPSTLHHRLVLFAVPFLALLPATAAMGATLPAMDRFLSPLSVDGRCIGTLYAANTLGAMSGTLASAFVLMPSLGFRASLFCLAVTEVLCGAAALGIDSFVAAGVARLPIAGLKPGKRSTPVSPTDHRLRGNEAPLVAAPPVPEQRGGGNGLPFWRSGFTIFFTGLLGIGFELAGIRVLAQVLENTIYTYAAALAVYLAGTAMGAAFYQKFGPQRSFRPTLMYLLCAAAAACLVGTRLLTLTHPLYDFCREALGDGLGAVLLSEIAAAATVFGLPTVVMGATFSHLVQGARHQGGGVGRAGALNSLGCAVATGFVGLLLLPACGSKWTLTLISLAYLGLLPQLKGWGWGTLTLSVALSLI